MAKPSKRTNRAARRRFRARAVDRHPAVQRSQGPRRAARAHRPGRARAQSQMRPGNGSRLCRRRQQGRHQRHRPVAAGRPARRAGGDAVAQFRQGSGAARRPRPCAARRRAVHGRRRPASARSGRYSGLALARRRLRRRLHRQGAPRERAMAAPRRRQCVLCADQLGRAATATRGCRRLPSAVAARGGGAAAVAGTQPLLQRARDLDRLPPGARRLRTGAARARANHLERVDPDRPVDRRAHLVFGGAAALRQHARRAVGGDRAALRRLDRAARPSSTARTCPAILRWSSA